MAAAGTLTLGPRAVERPCDAGWVELGTLEAPPRAGGRPPTSGLFPPTSGLAQVDGAGLVGPGGAGWSLDWWIGADDRWYLPARESTVRQRRLGAGPVIETLVRIPSGDARHRAWAVVAGSRPVTVVEIHNDSPVPVALALALRPYPVASSGDGAGPGPPPAFGAGLRLDGTVVSAGSGAALVVLPRPPSHAGASAHRDLLDAVQAGENLAWDGDVAGLGANAVALFPLPHRTSLRFLVLSGGPALGLDPRSVPEAEAVSRGWNAVVEAGARISLPDPGLSALANGARARLLLAAPALGAGLEALSPGAGPVLAALAAGGHRHEVAAALTGVVQGFPTRLPHGPGPAAEIVAALGPAVGLVEGTPGVDPSLRSGLVALALQLLSLVERAGGGGPGAARARDGAACVRDGAARARDDVARARDGAARLAHPLDPAGSARLAPGGDRGPAADLAAVNELVAQASPAGAWGGAAGDDPLAAARYVLALRDLVVADDGPGLVLLPGFPSSWRGGTVEVHRLPTAHGLLSFAIRWHGYRPALLWELDHPSPVELTAPALDVRWRTGAARGEALLSGSPDALPTAPGPGQDFE